VTPKFRIVSKTTAAEGFKTYVYVTPTFRIVSKTTAAEGFRTYDYVTPKFRIVSKTTAAELLTIAEHFQMRHDYLCALISTFISYTLLYTIDV
jgi:hypothetical protein